MASIITHIVQGKKIFDRLPRRMNWEEFVIGTTFPDIRYLSDINRDVTHIYDTSEDKVPFTSSFEAGRYVHSLIDERRVVLLKQLGMFDMIEYNYVNETALKLFEDVVLFESFGDWNEVIKTFSNTLPEELQYVPNIKEVEKWHKGVQEYIKNGPNQASWLKQFKTSGFTKDKVQPILLKVEEYAENPRLREILLNLNKKI